MGGFAARRAGGGHGAPRAAASAAVLLALYAAPAQSFSSGLCVALRGAAGRAATARTSARGAAPGLLMSGMGQGPPGGPPKIDPKTGLPEGYQPPKIDPKTGLPEGYEPPKLNKAQEAMIKRVIEKSKNSNKMKRVEFKSSATAVAKINDTGVGDNATLGTYMTLPAEQWVTLDDRCSRLARAPVVQRHPCSAGSPLPVPRARDAGRACRKYRAATTRRANALCASGV